MSAILLVIGRVARDVLYYSLAAFEASLGLVTFKSAYVEPTPTLPKILLCLQVNLHIIDSLRAEIALF